MFSTVCRYAACHTTNLGNLGTCSSLFRRPSFFQRSCSIIPAQECIKNALKTRKESKGITLYKMGHMKKVREVRKKIEDFLEEASYLGFHEQLNKITWNEGIFKSAPESEKMIADLKNAGYDVHFCENGSATGCMISFDDEKTISIVFD